MLNQYIQISQILRDLMYKAWDGLDNYMSDDEYAIISTIERYIVRDAKKLLIIWPRELPKDSVYKLIEYAEKRDKSSIAEIKDKIVPELEELIDDYFLKQPSDAVPGNIINFLHPKIVGSSYAQFRNGQYRDAVFNAFVAVFDLIREKTKIDRDGVDLVGEVFSLTHPKLIFSSLKTDSGRNEQKGFIQILQGAYQGVRNPKAHSLENDLDEYKSIQYLVFASLLARRIDESHKPIVKRKNADNNS